MRVPKPETALIPDFEKKVEAICRETVGQNVTAFAGFRRGIWSCCARCSNLRAKATCSKCGPAWSCSRTAHELQAYREQYRQLIPSDRMKYMETYNASEASSPYRTIRRRTTCC